MKNKELKMKYCSFGVKECKEAEIVNPYVNLMIYDRQLAIQIGELLRQRVVESFCKTEQNEGYKALEAEAKGIGEYIDSIKQAFPEIQFISTERKATNV